MTKARDIADFKFENIVDTGTEGTKVATGTTAERGSQTGQWRYNTTTGFFEGRNTDGTFSTLEPDPQVSSISPSTATEGSTNITITGLSFQSGATVKFIGNDGTEYPSPSVTVNSSSQIIATTPVSALTVSNEPYDIKVINPSGKSGVLGDALDAGGSPTWNTASGTLATIYDTDTGTHATVSATDPDGQTISYSETGGTVLSTNNFSLDSSTGVISGDPVNVASPTTHTFTLRASDGVNNNDRIFNIIVNPALDGSSSARAFNTVSNGDNYVISGNQYYIKTSSGASEQLYFYKYNNYAYALVGLRYQSSSAQTNINTNSQVGSISNQATFHLGTTKINYINNQVGLIMIPQQTSGALNTANVYANLFQNNSLPEIPSDTFTNNHAGESSSGFQARGVNLSTLNPNSLPTSGFISLEDNTHEGGNQILSYFGSNSGIENGGTNPLGMRWSNANGVGYYNDNGGVNDVTGLSRNLNDTPPISLFLLAR